MTEFVRSIIAAMERPTATAGRFVARNAREFVDQYRRDFRCVYPQPSVHPDAGMFVFGYPVVEDRTLPVEWRFEP